MSLPQRLAATAYQCFHARIPQSLLNGTTQRADFGQQIEKFDMVKSLHEHSPPTAIKCR